MLSCPSSAWTGAGMISLSMRPVHFFVLLDQAHGEADVVWHVVAILASPVSNKKVSISGGSVTEAIPYRRRHQKPTDSDDGQSQADCDY